MHQTWWGDFVSEVLNGMPAVVICLLYSKSKPPWQPGLDWGYNELDASQNVSSPNITHFRWPFQLAQGGGNAEFAEKKRI